MLINNDVGVDHSFFFFSTFTFPPLDLKLFSLFSNKMVKDENEQDYQDPLLIPGNIRKIVQNLPGKTKVKNDILLFVPEFITIISIT